MSMAEVVTTSESFLGTTLATSTFPIPSLNSGPQPYTFAIETSNQRQHVGRWYGRYISEGLTETLKNRCNDKKTGSNTCKTKKEKFDNIEYSDERGFVERGTKFVEVNVESDIPSKTEGVNYNGELLQKAFIAQIADTFQKSGEDEKNCYKFDQKSTICIGCLPLCFSARGTSRILRWCNAPEYVRVSLKDGQGTEIAHMKVVLKFTGTTDQGKFDCMVSPERRNACETYTDLICQPLQAIKESVEKSARDDRLKDVKKAIDGREVEARFSCSGEEVTGACPNEECMYQLGICFK
jgi:hypothetical protein